MRGISGVLVLVVLLLPALPSGIGLHGGGDGVAAAADSTAPPGSSSSGGSGSPAGSGDAAASNTPGPSNASNAPGAPAASSDPVAVPAVRPVSVLDKPPQRMREALAEAYRLRPDRRFLLAVACIHRFMSGQEETNVTARFADGRWRIDYRGIPVGTLPEFPDFPHFMTMLDGWVKALRQQQQNPPGPGPAPASASGPSGGAPARSEVAGSAAVPKEIEEELDRFLAPHAVSAAHKIDEAWNAGDRSPALLRAAARSLALLALQHLDYLETGDRLPGKAIAVLALAKALTDLPCDREESLLAHILGYSVHSNSVAASLLQSDPVRLFVTRDDRRLAEAATGIPAMGVAGSTDSGSGDTASKDIVPGDSVSRTPGSIEAKYLYLARLQREGKTASALEWMQTHFRDDSFSLPLVKVGLDLNKFSITPALSEALPRLALFDLAREAGILPGLMQIAARVNAKGLAAYSPEEFQFIASAVQEILTSETATIVDHFESGLNMLDAKYTGPFLDSETLKTYYTGYFFSGLYKLGQYYLDRLSSTDAANRFSTLLGQADAGIAADFRCWYRNLAASKAGKGNVASLVADIEKLTRFGAPPLMRTVEEQKEYFNFGDPGFLQAVKQTALRLDTRASHRFFLGDLAREHLLDLKLMETLYSGILDIDAPDQQDLYVWYANARGDYTGVMQALADANCRLSVRVKAVGYLDGARVMNHEELCGAYEKLINEDPDDWRIRKQYMEYLERRKEYSKARSVIVEWLDRDVRTFGLEKIFARSALASTYYKEGNYEKALEAIEPVVKSYQAGAMETGARILDRLGHEKESEGLGLMVVDRYPDVLWPRASLAEIYWRRGKNKEAAELLASAPHSIGMKDWLFTVAPKFASAFEDDGSKERPLAAFSALISQGFNPFELANLARPIAEKGKYELAFEMASRLRYNGLGNVELLVYAYRCLEAWKGREEALAWLGSKIPPQMLNAASMIFYRDGESELLWDLIPNPEQGSHADFVWLLRAAASARAGSDKDPHREELLKYYGGGSGNDGVLARLWSRAGQLVADKAGPKKPQGHYHQLGRFLVGLATEEEVLALATDPKKRCEIAYYVGLKAQGEKRFSDASDWYRVVIETGLDKNGEYRWAYDTLYKWSESGKCLSRLAETK